MALDFRNPVPQVNPAMSPSIRKIRSTRLLRRTTSISLGHGEEFPRGEDFTYRLHPYTAREEFKIGGNLNTLPAEVEELKRLQAETAAELEVLFSARLARSFKGSVY